MNAPATKGHIARLGNAQGWLCFHCNEPMLKVPAARGILDPKGAWERGWTREHVVPKSLGGFNRGNIVLAHRGCNNRRGNEPPGPGMMQRARRIWIAARESKWIVNDPAPSSGFGFHPYPGEPKFTPPGEG